jgi:hypothetical protein
LTSDPAKQAQLEAFFRDNPDRRAESEAALFEMERSAMTLLEREDARGLFLPPEEIEPWLTVLERRWQDFEHQLGDPESDAAPDAAAREVIADFLWSLTAEMARAIFTPQRTAQLTEQLKDYRDRIHAAGDQRALSQTHGALLSLERETEPAENPFINALCFVSLRAVLHAKLGGAATG